MDDGPFTPPQPNAAIVILAACVVGFSLWGVIAMVWWITSAPDTCTWEMTDR